MARSQSLALRLFQACSLSRLWFQKSGFPLKISSFLFFISRVSRNPYARVFSPSGGADLDATSKDGDDVGGVIRVAGGGARRTKNNQQDGGDLKDLSGVPNPRKKTEPTLKDAEEGRVGVLVRRKEQDHSFFSIFTLFVDGISNCIDYHQVRGMFAQFGRVVNLFVQ